MKVNIMYKRFVVSSCALPLLLAACAAPIVPVKPNRPTVAPTTTPTATLPPTSVPVVEPTVAPPEPVAPALNSQPPASCVVAGQETYVNPFDGYCFAYPARFELQTSGTGQPQLFGLALDQNLDALRASMALEVEVAVQDARLSEIVDRYAGQFAAMNVPAIIAVTQSFTFTSKKPRPIEVSPSPRDPGVSGVARWGTQPVPNALVELRTGDWRVNPNAVLQREATDPQGRYFMANAPAGDYVMCGLFPEGVQERSTCTPVRIEAGQDTPGIDVMLLRTVNTVAPTVDAQVVALPTLSWQSFPNAAQYEVFVSDAGTTELLAHEFVTDTHFTVTAALQPGRTYEWVVNAVAADGGLLATGDSRFAVQP
jgi:hypothetical protein